MKKLANLKSAKALSKKEQKSINGGTRYCPDGGNPIFSKNCINGFITVICPGGVVTYIPCE